MHFFFFFFFFLFFFCFFFLFLFRGLDTLVRIFCLCFKRETSFVIMCPFLRTNPSSRLVFTLKRKFYNKWQKKIRSFMMHPKNITGVYMGIHYFSYFCSKHRLWVLVRTALSSGSNE